MEEGFEEKLNLTNRNYKPEDIRKIINCWAGNMDVSGISINIRNIHKNFDQLKITLSDMNYKFDFISLTETWTNEGNAANAGILLDGYDVIWTKDKYNKNGGVALAVNNDNDYRIIETGEDNKIEADYLIVEVIRGHKNKIII